MNAQSQSITDRDWNLFGRLPESELDIEKMCLWEYGRHSTELCTAIAGLRDIVAKYFQLDEPEQIAQETFGRLTIRGGLLRPLKINGRTAQWPSPNATKESIRKESEFVNSWEERLAVINRIAGRFDWAFLCSAGFPDSPWLIVKPDGILGSGHALFHQPQGAFAVRTVRVEQGQKQKQDQDRKKRIKRIEILPKVYHSAWSLDDYLETGDMTTFNFLNEEIAAIMEPRVQGNSQFHCFVIPDFYFQTYNTDDLVKAFSRRLELLDQRVIVPSIGFALSRPSCDAYLRWLGAWRFYHLLTKAEQKKERLRFNRAGGTESKIPRPEARNFEIYLGDRASEFRKKAVDVFARIFTTSEEMGHFARTST